MMLSRFRKGVPRFSDGNLRQNKRLSRPGVGEATQVCLDSQSREPPAMTGLGGRSSAIDASRRLRTLALLAALGVSLPLLAGFFGRWHPALDSFSHFRLHLAVLLGLTLLPLFALRSLKLGVPLMVAAFLAFATTSGAFPWIGMKYGAIHAAEPKRPLYRLVQLNLRYIHPEPALVLSMIGRIKPDVITFNEVSPSWAEKLKLIKATYRYSIFCPFPKRLWGVAIMSRRPFAEDGAPFCAPEGTFAIASVDFGGQTADIAALHLGWPWPFPQYREIGGAFAFHCTIAADGHSCRRPQRRAVEPFAGPRLRRRRPDADALRRSVLARPPPAECPVLCRSPDRPGLRQGRHIGAFGPNPRSGRIRPSAGARGIFAEAETGRPDG